MSYGLGFISDTDLLNHVKATVQKYRFTIDLQKFNKNIVDPIKLTFDSKIYQKDISYIIDSEIIRQIDKSNTNHIGYFHQNIFRYMGKGWEVPTAGYDVIHPEKSYFAEIKNKHNTMNAASAQKTYMKMQGTILKNDAATCFLVEVISKNSQNINWTVSIDGNQMSHKNIRRISMDKFYELVTGHQTAFRDLYQILPKVITDVVKDMPRESFKNSVFEELQNISPNVIESLYLLSFKKYEGFGGFHVIE